MKTQKCLLYAACACIFLTLSSGCRVESDVTNDPRFHDGWTIGGEYVFLKDAYLIESDFLMKPVPGGTFPAVSEWKANPTEYSNMITGVIYSGTHLGNIRLSWVRSLDMNDVRVRGKILDGEFAGHEVRLLGITKVPDPALGFNLPYIESLDPTYLRLVSPPK